MRFEDQRKIMIEKNLISRGINDKALLKAFDKVPRENFVPDEWRQYAYQDHPLQIACKQTISQPFIIAYMMQLLEIKSDDIVLEIGTGSGYQTALLAELSKEVYTVERFSELSMSARKVLRSLNYTNIFYRIGDGTKGWDKAIPVQTEFDKIVVCAGSPDIPVSLINQLRLEGRLVIPVGNTTEQKVILLIKHEHENEIIELAPCTFVPLIGQEGWSA
ncbi:MAG TPA: protein-L-isoaspartate(D-aspartate) O-methyltransferase [Candidatus Cloacimonadota bacterium]|nr:protein-L-isoaspartate(D-aspartate) O-methyltransferase [Candidatus Cloacimonadota bacterium]HOD53495.1 protein-L-isoaspartate(D-aspartate) O-methyltransferase [Candidatus Cloacimonadota bacterium]HPM01779.1 protein-L-isoaspartate(D-aspartate) O-methyltransferase [Candidatus Cloacimonadota bacterium]